MPHNPRAGGANWLGLLAVAVATAALLVWPDRGHAQTAPGRYVITTEGTIAGGTVHDTKTNLTWQREAPPVSRTWTETQSDCAALGEGGRVPSFKELRRSSQLRAESTHGLHRPRWGELHLGRRRRALRQQDLLGCAVDDGDERGGEPSRDGVRRRRRRLHRIHRDRDRRPRALRPHGGPVRFVLPAVAVTAIGFVSCTNFGGVTETLPLQEGSLDRLGCGGSLCGHRTAEWPMPHGPESGFPNPMSYSVADGVVSDEVTRLKWEQASPLADFTWEDAARHCDALELGGFSDWRLPSTIELLSLIDFTKTPMIDQTVFRRGLAERLLADVLDVRTWS